MADGRREVEAIRFERPRLVVLDQALLPLREVRLPLDSLDAVCEAIRSLRVRGAPLLGLAGAAGMAIAAEADASDSALEAAARSLIATRPTAVDLEFRTRQALAVALAAKDVANRAAVLWDFATALLEEQRAADLALARQGAPLLAAGSAVLTHCNTGALATGGIGTALGVVRVAWEAGRVTHCYATETRPLLQGARLTAWELAKLGIPHSLVPDTAVASLLASGRVGAVVVGADRIAANGDTANKVGTYGIAVIAARHGIPFHIAAPTSTIDADCPAGDRIPIEFRADEEVGGYGEWRWSPPGTRAYNPAFDITPAELITAIITERGVLRPPFEAAIAGLALGR